MIYEVEVTLKFHVQADTKTNAEAIVSQEMFFLNDYANLSDYFITEYDNPVVKSS